MAAGNDELLILNLRACPSCRSCNTQRGFKKWIYQYYRCTECGTQFVFPTPDREQAVELYTIHSGQTSTRHCWQSDLSSRGHLQRHWNRILDLVGEDAPPGPLLDIGCGRGPLLELAKLVSHRALFGVELNQDASFVARKKTGAVVYDREVSKCGFLEGSFAIVTLLDVIEHLTEPFEEICHIGKLLLPGGFLAISTVNLTGISLRLLGKNALAVCPPEHLTLFNINSLVSLVQRCGYKVVTHWSASLYIREWSRFLGGGDERYVRVRNTLSLSGLRYGIEWADQMLEMCGVGDQLYLVAQKPFH